MSRTPISNLQRLWRVTASSLTSIALAGMLLAVITISALAADGDVVPSFAPQLIRGGEVSQVVLQPDGKILLVGRFTTINGVLRPYLARLNPDGSLDQSFTPPAIANLTGILLQPDGKILVR